MEDTDEALIQRARRGDDRAFAALVEKYSTDCLRFATQMLRNRADAEEVVQDTFIRAYRNLNRYDHRGHLRAWLYRILVNQCRTRIVAMKRRAAFLTKYQEEALSSALVSTPHAYANGNGVEMERVYVAVAKLPPEQREAFLLKYVEELTYEEMSEATGAGVSALKMRTKRGFDRLRSLLLNGGADEGVLDGRR